MKKPAPAVAKVIHNGRAFYSLADTAKLLGTNIVKVKQLLGEGKLELMQRRLNSKTFYVSGESIIRYKYRDRAQD